MRNIIVEKTSNNTYVVKADTERFGKQEIMFESYCKVECVRYIIRTAVKLYVVTKQECYLAVLLRWMDERKRNQYDENRGRNSFFTSHYGFSMTYVFMAEDGGLYIKCRGCRSSFSVFFNADGTTAKRAPKVKNMRRIGFSYNF